MSSHKHSSSKPPSAKQLRLDGIFAMPVLASASPDISVTSLVTPIPTNSSADSLFPSEQIQSVRDPDSSTGNCSESVLSAKVKHVFNHKWLTDSDFYDKDLNMAVFHQDPASCGVICSICFMHKEVVKSKGQYVTEPAFPKRKLLLSKHLETDTHKEARQIQQMQSSSALHKGYMERVKCFDETVAQRIRIIYWLVKEEIANRKLESLQNLINDVGENEKLRAFKHTSSTAVSEFIQLISSHLSNQIVSEAKLSIFWSSMVDESTDISVFQQYVTFIRYVDSTGTVHVKFLDIRPVGPEGATSNNLVKMFKQVAADYDLSLSNHVAMSCDGAAAMFGRVNGVAKQLEDEIGTMVSVHCLAHRLALAATDSVEPLQTLRNTERLLIHLWKFFACSPLRSSKLAEIQGLFNTKQRQLIRTCKTRWLSCERAVIAALSEIIAVWAALEYFSNERADPTATGLLGKTKNVNFIMNLQLFNCVLPHLSALSKLFQTGDLNFAQVQPAVDLCKMQVMSVVEDSLTWKGLQEHWPQKYLTELGELTDEHKVRAESLASRYCKEICKEIDRRFPEPAVLTSFKIFDPAFVPHDRQQRNQYGEDELQRLCAKYGPLLEPGVAYQINAEWVLLRDKLVTEFRDCRTAADVCQRMIRSPAYSCFPNLCTFAKIALTIPMSTAWPERGFSTLKRIKTSSRNRLLTRTLNSLVNISMNGPDTLSVKESLVIAKSWQDAKERRRVNDRVNRSRIVSHSADDLTEDENDPDGGFDGSELADMIDSDSFWL